MIMTATSFFIFGGMIGALLFLEGSILRNSQGQLNKLVVLISTLEFIWLLTCVYALFTIDFPGWTILLPAAYISYFIVASRHFHSITSDIENFEDLKKIVIPTSLVRIEIYAGLAYLIINALAWLQFSGTNN